MTSSGGLENQEFTEAVNFGVCREFYSLCRDLPQFFKCAALL